MTNEIFQRHRRALIDVAAAYMVATLILSAVVVLWVFKDIPVGHFTRDPANSFNFQFYVGSVSTIGGILWTATATLCIFSANLLRTNEASSEQKEMSNFFLASGFLTLLLLFDDVFLFHEQFFPNHLGIPDYFTFPAYAVITLSYLVIFRRVVLKTHYLVRSDPPTLLNRPQETIARCFSRLSGSGIRVCPKQLSGFQRPSIPSGTVVCLPIGTAAQMHQSP